jgi:hypothetical protein
MATQCRYFKKIIVAIGSFLLANVSCSLATPHCRHRFHLTSAVTISETPFKCSIQLKFLTINAKSEKMYQEDRIQANKQAQLSSPEEVVSGDALPPA